MQVDHSVALMSREALILKTSAKLLPPVVEGTPATPRQPGMLSSSTSSVARTAAAATIAQAFSFFASYPIRRRGQLSRSKGTGCA
nr:putative integron gene cassette protein [uncultured bacterium]